MTEHIQMNLFDEEILHPNCTVQELRNTETGEASFGWWENENPPKGVAKTHYDHVKAMSPEEMAEWIDEFWSAAWCPDDPPIDPGTKRCLLHDGDCRLCILDWLKQEVGANV